MNDKQQLQAMGEHQAEQRMCMAKQIEDLQARLQECANGAAKMQEQRDYAYKMMGKFGSERDALHVTLKAANQRIAMMVKLLRETLDVVPGIGVQISDLPVIDDFLERIDAAISGERHGIAMLAAAPKPDLPDQRLTVENSPVGTIAPSITGGRWYRTELGWKWNGPNGSGGTFPRPGGDWNGKLIAPKPEPTK